MSLTLPVYVIGFGDLYQTFFNAIAATVNSAGYHQLLKLMIMLGGTWTLVVSACRQQLSLNVRWLMTYFVLTSVILVPTVTVNIQDRTSAHTYSVSHVPLGLGLLANLTTSIGTGFTELIESVFHTPNDLNYTQSGMLMGAKMVRASTQFHVIGGHFQKNLQQFVQQCVFYDVLLHKYSIDDLSHTPNLWHFVSQHASPARAFVYNDTVVTCQKGAHQLSQEWTQALHQSTHHYAQQLFSNKKNNQNATAQLMSYLATSNQTLAQLSENASTVLQQSMMIHAIQETAESWPQRLNPNGLTLSSAAFAKAQAQKREGYHLLYHLAVYWLPLTKAAMELVLLGASLILVLFLLFPLGTALLKNTVMTFLWLQLWPPLFSFENFILTYYGQTSISHSSLLPNGTHGLTLSTFSQLNQSALDLGTLGGFFVALTPLLSAGLFKGMMTVFSQAAGYLGGAMQTVAFTGAGEAVTGNLNLGNTQFNTHSAHNTHVFQQQSNPTVQSGLLNYQLSDGGMASLSPSGQTVLNTHPALSQLPVTPHMAHAMQTSLTQMADKAEDTAQHQMHSAQTAYSNALHELSEVGQQQQHTTGHSSTQELTTSGHFSQAAHEVHQLTERFAKEHQISYNKAEQIIGSVYFDTHAQGALNVNVPDKAKLLGRFSHLGGTASVTGGYKADKSNNHSHQYQKLYQDAQTFVDDHNFTQTVDHALRAADTLQAHDGDESLQRTAHQISDQFEQANRYTEDANASYNQSESYREQAQAVQQDSMSIDTQASQAFMDWLQQQPSPNHPDSTLNMEDVALMMQHDLPKAEEYAEQFIQTQRDHYLKALTLTEYQADIKAHYEKHKEELSMQPDALKDSYNDFAKRAKPLMDGTEKAEARIKKQVNEKLALAQSLSENDAITAKANALKQHITKARRHKRVSSKD